VRRGAHLAQHACPRHAAVRLVGARYGVQQDSHRLVRRRPVGAKGAVLLLVGLPGAFCFGQVVHVGCELGHIGPFAGALRAGDKVGRRELPVTAHQRGLYPEFAHLFGDLRALRRQLDGNVQHVRRFRLDQSEQCGKVAVLLADGLACDIRDAQFLEFSLRLCRQAGTVGGLIVHDEHGCSAQFLGDEHRIRRTLNVVARNHAEEGLIPSLCEFGTGARRTDMCEPCLLEHGHRSGAVLAALGADDADDALVRRETFGGQKRFRRVKLRVPLYQFDGDTVQATGLVELVEGQFGPVALLAAHRGGRPRQHGQDAHPHRLLLLRRRCRAATEKNCCHAHQNRHCPPDAAFHVAPFAGASPAGLTNRTHGPPCGSRAVRRFLNTEIPRPRPYGRQGRGISRGATLVGLRQPETKTSAVMADVSNLWPAPLSRYGTLGMRCRVRYPQP